MEFAVKLDHGFMRRHCWCMVCVDVFVDSSKKAIKQSIFWLKVTTKCMKYFYVYIALLALLLGVSLLRTWLDVEGFTNAPVVVLMGDSILKNDAYVSRTNGKTVHQWLLERRPDVKVMNLAEDHAKLTDVSAQVERLPFDLDAPSTTIFLSAGGNDLLSYYVDQQREEVDGQLMECMRTLLKVRNSIHARLPHANVVCLDVYYPPSATYQPFHSIIQTWNRELASIVPNLLRISTVVTQSDDFVMGVEPSSSGGKKIATMIGDYSVPAN